MCALSAKLFDVALCPFDFFLFCIFAQVERLASGILNLHSIRVLQHRKVLFGRSAVLFLSALPRSVLVFGSFYEFPILVLLARFARQALQLFLGSIVADMAALRGNNVRIRSYGRLPPVVDVAVLVCPLVNFGCLHNRAFGRGH